jgi:hypothetical protein
MEMSSSPTLLVVALDMPPGIDEAAFDRWYETEHIPERLACPGFVSVSRYRSEATPRYLAIYELEGPEALRSREYLGLSERESAESKRWRAQMTTSLRGVFAPGATIRAAPADQRRAI